VLSFLGFCNDPKLVHNGYKKKLQKHRLRLELDQDDLLVQGSMNGYTVATEVTNKNTSKASNQLNYISINFGGFTHKLTRVQTTILLEDFLPSTLPPLAEGPTASATREDVLGLQLPPLLRSPLLEAGLSWAAVLAARVSRLGEA